MGVLVERTSRLVLLAKMEGVTAASALAGFSAKLNSIIEPMRQSLTYDQGKKLSRHKELTAQTGVKVYFCDLDSPWQRGTCENTNGLLRQYMPKGIDLSLFSQDKFDAIADSMNGVLALPTPGIRPWKCSHERSPRRTSHPLQSTGSLPLRFGFETAPINFEKERQDKANAAVPAITVLTSAGELKI